MSVKQEAFINDEIWVLTFAAAFQRANIYKKNIPEEKKKQFKGQLREFVEDLVHAHYQNQTLDDTTHVENIKLVSEGSSNSILRNGKLNFGVSQKLFNLYLKYQWCLNKIPIPPHLPVDRIIQQKSGLKVIPWTQIEDENVYMDIINAVRNKANKNCQPIAEYELMYFKRR
ncbi:hypothetical protein LS482_08755 [Sinomicrobium kalidii]|uniref:hypothetical protein n=1 Tax=Sinomicrobium kalidii TaxID=2900738 RepID=UPI001E4DAE7C|nr:hypothetical protein [Sinomicrobium kalidii]UGU17957.1 hypothetical protein LS482_08755 [Sinomicrobium kalidii]